MIAKWSRDAISGNKHHVKETLLKQWLLDPSWGTVVAEERHIMRELERTDKRHSWMMETEIRERFKDADYCDALIAMKQAHGLLK